MVHVYVPLFHDSLNM